MLFWLGGALLLAVEPGFAQCPAVGASTGCGVVITINPDLSLSFATQSGVLAIDATSRPLSADDILVGVVNHSGTSIDSLNLAGLGVVTTTNPNPGNAFAFDLDGLCAGNYGAPNPSPMGCNFDLSGYGGPGTSLSALASDPTLASGTVTFIGGLANGASAYFSLEAPPTSGTAIVPEPTSLVLTVTGLAGLLWRRRGSGDKDRK
jgi:hypothetical protein